MLRSIFKTAMFFAVAYPAVCNAQTYQQTALGAKAVIKNQTVEVQFYSPDIVRVIKTPEGQSFNKESLSVIKKPENTQLRISRQGDILNIKSSKINVALDFKTGALYYTTISGSPLLKEKPDGTSFKPFNDAGSKTF